MKAIILGAGIGNRLGEKGRILPKCLIKVGKETILERQTRILNDLNINEVTLVIGSQGDCWKKKKNVEKIKKVNKKIVVNKKNIDLKRPYSLFCGLGAIEKDDLIVIDGDFVFEEELIKKFMDDKRKNLILASYIESKYIESKGTKIIVGENDRVVNIGYGFPGNKLFLGIFKIGKKDFDLFKQILARKENWNKNLSTILEEFTKQIEGYVLTINPFLSVVPEREIKATESWKPAKNWIEKKGSIIRKKTKIGKKKLINEVNFIQNLPENVKKHFPKIIDYSFDQEVAYYDMEYCPYPSFLDLIFDKKISVKESLEILKTILDFVFNNLYKINVKQTPVGFIRDSYFDKVKQRFNAVKGVSPLFDKIASADNLIINGKKVKNFNIIINEIKNDIKFMSSLEPPTVSTYHGDFRFKNMLVNQKNKDFMLIDPRGKTAAGHDKSDLVEDIAKILMTCRGYYPIFHRNLFDMRIKENQNIIINYKLKATEIVNYFEKIMISLMKILPNYEQIKNDPNWKKRLFFIQAMLLIANSPFHLDSENNEKFSIALLARGIELLNDFLDKYPLKKEKKYKVININSIEDYKKVKNLVEFDFG